MTRPTPTRLRSAHVGTLLLFTTAALPGALAQTQVATLPGDESNDYFGFSAADLGDVNADGIPDFGIGGYRGSVAGRGRLKVYSGLDGSLIHHILGPPSGTLGGIFSAGDINGDGYDDFGGNHLIGAARAAIFSGLDGSELVSVTGAYLFGGAGDVNGDGKADYVTSTGSGTGVTYSVTSGSTGSPLGTLVVPTSRWFGGYVGDVNGDLIPDYGEVGNGTVNSTINVRSGVNGALFFTSATERDTITRVVEIGDVNNDGFTDVGVLFDHYRSVDILSGHDGELLVTLRDIYAAIPPSDGLAGVPDADGDGHDDFVVASFPPRLYSGRTGGLLAQFVRDDGARRAFSVVGIPDANGDGRPEIAVGSPSVTDPVTFGGTAALFRYDGPAGANYCVANANSTGAPAEITASGSTSLTRNNLLLSIHSAPTESIGIFLMGTGQQQTALGSGVLCVGSGGGFGIARLPAANIDINGHMLLEFDATSVPGSVGAIQAGSTRTFQAWFRDASPSGPVSNLSDAVSVTFTL